MTLAQIFAAVNKKTYFSREDDEIWAAISNAASTVYLQTVAENSGFFITFDTTSLTLAPNTEEYSLPQQCGTLVRMRERILVTDSWAVMTPADINAPTFTEAQFSSLVGDSSGPGSAFQYYGPYLTQAAAQLATKIERIRVDPVPQENRFVELVYIAKFADISGDTSPKVLPDEADGVVMWSAVEELLVANDDDNHENANAQKDENLRWYLKWVRNRQFQQGRHVEPYVEDLD